MTWPINTLDHAFKGSARASTRNARARSASFFSTSNAVSLDHSSRNGPSRSAKACHFSCSAKRSVSDVRRVVFGQLWRWSLFDPVADLSHLRPLAVLIDFVIIDLQLHVVVCPGHTRRCSPRAGYRSSSPCARFRSCPRREIACPRGPWRVHRARALPALRHVPKTLFGCRKK